MKANETKKQLANSFEKLAKEMPISKITITEIIKDCNVNRKTFYYHFEDIYSLFKWIHNQGAIDFIKQVDLITNYEEVVLFIIEYLRINKKELKSAFDAFGFSEMKRIFHDDFFIIMKKLIDTVEKNENLNVSEEFKNFVCAFYTEAVAGYVINLIVFNETLDDEKIIEFIRIIFKSSIPEILKNGSKQ